MIKVKAKKGKVDLKIYGTLDEICADTVTIVKSIKDSLAKGDPDCGRSYEKMMEALLIDAAFHMEDKPGFVQSLQKKEAEEKDKESENGEAALKEIVSLLGKLNLLK